MKKKTHYVRSMKRAVHLLFYRRHRKPGAKGWELRRRLGKDYPKVLDVLNNYLEKLDLQVKTVFEEEVSPEKPTIEDLDKARFYIVLRGGLTPKESKLSGWRIDDIAGLAVSIAYIISNRGEAPRDKVEEVLRNKLPEWRVDVNIDRYIRSGYLSQNQKRSLRLDWRTKAEVDQESLIKVILSTEVFGREYMDIGSQD